MVRDSRAVAYSWLRKKVGYEAQGKTTYMRRLDPVTTPKSWMPLTFLIEPLKLRSLGHATVRYKDLYVTLPET